MKKTVFIIIILLIISCVYTLTISDEEVEIENQVKRVFIVASKKTDEKSEDDHLSPIKTEYVDSSNKELDKVSEDFMKNDFQRLSKMLVVAFELFIYT